MGQSCLTLLWNALVGHPCRTLLWHSCRTLLWGTLGAIEWPKGCTLNLVAYSFEGCAVGLRGKDELPITKPWTVATNHEGIGLALSRFRCSCTSDHAEGRGRHLRETQSYTYRMTDASLHVTWFIGRQGNTNTP